MCVDLGEHNLFSKFAFMAKVRGNTVPNVKIENEVWMEMPKNDLEQSRVAMAVAAGDRDCWRVLVGKA